MSTVKKRVEYLGLLAVKYKHRYSRIGDYLRRVELGYHAARAARSSRAACYREYLFVYLLNALDKVSVGVASRVAVVKSVNVREVEKQIGFTKSRNVSRENVVSAELG